MMTWLFQRLEDFLEKSTPGVRPNVVEESGREQKKPAESLTRLAPYTKTRVRTHINLTNV